MNGNAEITPSRIASRCLWFESLVIGPESLFSIQVAKLFNVNPPLFVSALILL